jgi:hypothetical protein
MGVNVGREFSNSNIRQSIISLWRDSFKNIIFIVGWKKKFQKRERNFVFSSLLDGKSRKRKMLIENERRERAEGET